MQTRHNYLFVSDFHVGTGRIPLTGLYSRQEDFFQDLPFARFLYYHADHQMEVSQTDPDSPYNRPWKLVINGDLFEFMEITSMPAQGEELKKVRGVSEYSGLSDNEQKYGLGTRPAECRWKLELIRKGHPLLFQALAWFLAHRDYELMIIKGNHDIELYWEEVQETFRELLISAYKEWQSETVERGPEATPLSEHTGMASLDELGNKLPEVLQFPPSFWYEKDLFYAEHGGQYDYTSVFNSYENPVLSKNEEDPESDLIQLPSGALFVRYAFNEAEQIHPFAENIKPVPLRYFLWLVRERPKNWWKILKTGPRAMKQIRMKKRNDRGRAEKGISPEPGIDPAANGLAGIEGGDAFCDELLRLQEASRENLQWLSGKILRGNLWGGLLSILILISLIFTLKGFVLRAHFLVICGCVVIAILLWVFRLFLAGRLDDVVESPFLLDAARKINEFLNTDKTGLDPVPYYIFGHNHREQIAILNPPGRGKSGTDPVWYVNTGSWLPEFHESDPFREEYRLIFLRLVPGRPRFGTDPPELLQWADELNTPVKARVFDKVQPRRRKSSKRE